CRLGGGAVLVARPLPIHIDQIDASALVGPSALHAFQGRAGHVRDRHHRARHLRRVELAHHVWTVCTELISSPCTPLVRTPRLPGFAPFATVTDTYQCCPVGISTP